MTAAHRIGEGARLKRRVKKNLDNDIASRSNGSIAEIMLTGACLCCRQVRLCLPARRIVLTEAREDLETLEVNPPDQNPKGQLQELLQAISPVSPVYPIVSAEGPEHQKRFIARVTWNRMELGSGQGRSKKEAETEAARDALLKRLWKALPIEKQDRSSALEKAANNPPTTASIIR